MSTNPCSPKDVACNLTWDATGSAPAATAAEYFIGRPATVIGIIVGAFVVRWFARKVIDRAKGILIDECGMKEGDAFTFIQRTAMSERTRMRDVAERVLDGSLRPG